MAKKLPIEEMDEAAVQKAARKKCLDLLMRSDKTEGQLRKKLKEGGFPPSAIDDAISYAAGFHYIDDVRYVKNYLDMNRARKSTRQIRFDLEQRGVARELIDEALSGDDSSEEEALAYLIEKKIRGKDLSEPKERERVYRYLCGKGFSYDAVKRMLTKYLQKD